VTTFTTAVAFLANVFSKLMPIRSFGIFAAVMIPMNYFLVITVYPAVLMIHERYFNWIFPWCWKQCKRGIKVTSKDEIPEENAELEKPKRSKGSLIERFFGGPYMTFLKYARFIIIPVVLIWIGFAIWRASLMTPLSE